MDDDCVYEWYLSSSISVVKKTTFSRYLSTFIYRNSIPPVTKVIVREGCKETKKFEEPWKNRLKKDQTPVTRVSTYNKQWNAPSVSYPRLYKLTLRLTLFLTVLILIEQLHAHDLKT